MQNNKQDNIQSELEFRIKFKEEYGIDYLEAVDKLNKMKEQNRNEWQQVILKYNLS